MSHFTRILILTVVPLFSGFAYAQTEGGSSSIRLPKLGSSTKIKEDLKLQVGVMQSDYISSYVPSFRNGASDTNTSLILRLETEFKSLDIDGAYFRINIKDEYASAENWNYFDVYEFYQGQKFDGVQFSLGRKLETWAEWDSQWKMGIFQPRYMENRLRREEAGLSGLFFSAGTEKFSATVAYLPLFLPDFGPNFYVRDNSLYSRNPWFHPPTDRFQLNSKLGEIHYRVLQPKAEDVIFHQGAAAKIEYRDHGYSSRLSAAYKPMSSLLVGFPSQRKGTFSNAGTFFEINIVPRVTYNRIVSWENAYRHEDWRYTMGVAHDHPDDNGGPLDYTSQQVTPANYFTGGVERRIDDHNLSLQFNVMKVSGGDAPDRGKFGSEKTLFDRRILFNEAYSLGVRKGFANVFSYSADTEVKVLYDRMQQGGILMVSSGLNFSRQLRAELQADFVGLLSAENAVSDGFFDTYRANDRVGLGVNYVF